MSKQKNINDVVKSIDDLASIVNKEFGNVNKEFSNVKSQLKVLNEGQEDIKLRLTNVAYRFELVEIERKFDIRLKRLEKKMGIK